VSCKYISGLLYIEEDRGFITEFYYIILFYLLQDTL